MKYHPKTPVLVGAGQVVDRKIGERESLSPIDLATEASLRAINSVSVDNTFLDTIDVLAMSRFFQDSVRGESLWPNPFGSPDNVPGALAKRLKISPSELIYAEVGGETPQRLVNQFSQRIFSGEIRTALISGAEAIATIKSGIKKNIKYQWHENIGGSFRDLWPEKEMATNLEKKYGMTLPISVYALFEQVRRHKKGLSSSDYREEMAKMLVNFNAVASANQFSQYPANVNVDFLRTISKENFLLCEPYTKWMVAQDAVNQGASLIMTSIEIAEKYNIPKKNLVFLTSYADCDDDFVSKRSFLDKSEAQGLAIEHAFSNASITLNDLDYLDLYSCFPIAIFSACDYLGINVADLSRPLTVTGGLPFFGGPGNNYSLHAIAETIEKLQLNTAKATGAVIANGGYLSKHSVGIYSNFLAKQWMPSIPCKTLPKSKLVVVEVAEGIGIIESYSVSYNRSKISGGFIIGRSENGNRFLAKPSRESTSYDFLCNGNPIGKKVLIKNNDGYNFFTVN